RLGTPTAGRTGRRPGTRPAGDGQRRPEPVRAVRLLRARGTGDLPAARRRPAHLPARGTQRPGGTGDPGGPGLPGAGDRAQPRGHHDGDDRGTLMSGVRRGVAWTVAWTEERSDEGRRRTRAPRGATRQAR